jgi:hypothetical protein
MAPYIMAGEDRSDGSMRRLLEELRTKRRTVADALDVVRLVLGLQDAPRGQIQIAPFCLPSGEWTALVNVVFPELGCIVSLPTSAQFRARSAQTSEYQEFEISRLDGAEVDSEASVLLADGIPLRAVEVLPTHLPYKPSELDERILRLVISLTGSEYCYRSIREGLPEHRQHQVPDVRGLDYSRVRKIQAPPLKVIRGFIEDQHPDLKVSNQKIADALARFGIRVPRPRPRAISSRTPSRATI